MQDLVKKDTPRSFCDAVGGQVSISSDIQVQFFDQMHYYFFNWRGEEAPERDRGCPRNAKRTPKEEGRGDVEARRVLKTNCHFCEDTPGQVRYT
jgi:hypothetical protein